MARARFLLKHAQKYNFEYLSVMQKLLLPTGITVHDNHPACLLEIADKIDAAGGPYQLTDMVSVIIEASQPKQIITVIRALHEDSDVDIVRMTTEERGSLLKVNINVVYCDSIIGEVIIEHGQEPAPMRGA